MGGFEVFERLQESAVTLQKFDELFNSLRLWLTAADVERFRHVRARLVDDVEDMKEYCLDNDICPICGGEIKSKTIIDEDVGRVTWLYCDDCKHRFNED